ncbi:DoxX family protein [Maribellus sp. CM-23]|uniref:DoxX family protein n=1 Tax=Maribellus sp. CM-23 TaxID=2781026 RepID=UPI001F37ACFE|nr:DoxX family protein [Maribellus sp. CM-23]MCE4564010.1 DoxX family protein [Maribellus sp. CM-23]
MKKIFSTRLHPSGLHFSLLILRVGTGAFMLTHGYPKLQRLLSGEFQFADPFGLGPGISLGLAVFAEFFCSILLILGLGTRLATIPLIVTMSVAAFIAHGADPFARKEMALLYLLSYVVLLFSGPGKISVDQLLGKR